MNDKNVKMDFQDDHSEVDDLRAQLGREMSKSDDLENAILKTQLEEMAKKIANLEKQLQTGNANAHSQRISKVLNKIDYKKIEADRKRGVEFSDDGTVLIKYPTTLTNETYNIPDGVMEIENNAFSCVNHLSNVVIPSSVTEIGKKAFYSCSNLTNVVIPDSVTKIGYGAFQACSSLTSVVIPDGVRKIKQWTFEGCSKLTSVVIPNSVIIIEHQAFLNCYSLTSVVIPDSVRDIGYGAFQACLSLTSVVIPNSVRKIKDTAFWTCSKLTRVVIPDGVLVEDEAFDNSCEVIYTE